MIDQQIITDLRRVLKSSKTTELADEVSWLQKALQAEELLAHYRIVNSTKEIAELKHHLATQPISHLLPTVRKAWMPIQLLPQNSPFFYHPFTLETNASIRGIGAIYTLQPQTDSQQHPGAYASQFSTP